MLMSAITIIRTCLLVGCLGAIVYAQSTKPSVTLDVAYGVDADYFVAKNALERLRYVQNPPQVSLLSPMQGTLMVRGEYQYSQISGGFEAIAGYYAFQLPFSLPDSGKQTYSTHITQATSRRIGGAARMSYHFGNPIVGFDPYITTSIGWVHHKVHIADTAYFRSWSILDYPFASEEGTSMRPYARLGVGLRYISPFRFGLHAEVAYRSPILTLGLSHKIR